MIRGFSIISPASSYLIDYPNRVERGCKFLNKCGYNVNFEKNASKKCCIIQELLMNELKT